MRPETREVSQLSDWFKAEYPQYELSWRVSLSGEHFGKGAAAAMRKNLHKAIGIKNGESDLSILLSRGGYGCLILEHKAEGDKRGATDEQIEYVDYHNEKAGNCAVITKGIEAAKAAISQYMEMV